MTENEKTPPLNEAVTPDQVAEVIKRTYCKGITERSIQLADLYATADPAFDREEFLKGCGI